MPHDHYFATCPKGLEQLLNQELQSLGAEQTRETVAGVYFSEPSGSKKAVLYKACLWSRLANKILLPLRKGEIDSAKALYALVNDIAWEDQIVSGASLKVDFIGSNHIIRHTNFGAQSVKDAIVDRLRDKRGERPSVDRTNPDIIINARLVKGELHLALDLSGESLHRRGYRVEQGGAPLKENLAAAILLRAGWPEIAARGGALLDPMCGSGTFLIEAAMMAADIAPGLMRSRFGFHSWAGFDADVFAEYKNAAIERERAGLLKGLPEIRGYDIDPRMVQKAENNIYAAGLEKVARVSQKALVDFVKPSHKKLEDGLVICNPPYGERLGEIDSLRPVYQQLAAVLKRELCGWQLAVFTGNEDLGKELRLRAKRKYKLFNGAIPSQLLLFDLVDHDTAKLKPPPIEKQSPSLSEGATMVLNRINKNKKRLARWRKNAGIDCYRVYDADMPEYAAAIDVYGKDLHIQEYAAPSSIDEDKAAQRFDDLLAASACAFDLELDELFIKQRKRNKGKQQYEKRYADETDKSAKIKVSEDRAEFYVNLNDYLDTGLFLDHRPLRMRIAEEAQGKHFLNLFCYTASASVHAALGGAASSVSVDMSNTYLEWADDNFSLNNIHKQRHRLQRADCFEWLKQCRQGFDLILLDPPSFSNSKKMDRVLDIQRDHVQLVDRCMDILTPNGTLYFSNNLRKFKIDEAIEQRYRVKNISAETLDPDFQNNPKIHHCWEIKAR